MIKVNDKRKYKGSDSDLVLNSSVVFCLFSFKLIVFVCCIRHEC